MKSRHSPIRRVAALLVALPLLASPLRAEQAAAKVFVPPATVVFLGDSITQNGRYQHVIQLALAARYPGKVFFTVNKGWNGEEAGQGEKRFEWDVMPARPDVIFVHFGMNDVKRLEYTSQGIPNQERRDAMAERYRKDLGSLIVKASGDGRRVVVLSPTLYDSTQQRAEAGHPEIETELVRYTGIAREIAAKHDLPFVDLQTPMRTLTTAMQAKDPKAGFAKDGVHPNEAGHLVMAWQILKSLDFDPVVYEVELEAGGRVSQSEKVEIVDSVKPGGGGLSWEQQELVSPIPVEQPPIEGLDLIPFHDDLNRMTLRVKGLSAGDYQIQVDGETLATVTAAELAEGVNLASYPNLPHYRELAPLREALYKKKPNSESMLRDFAQARASFEQRGIGTSINWADPDPASLQAALDEFIAKEGGEARLSGWSKRMLETARKIFPRLPTILADLKSQREALTKAPSARVHRYAVVPAK